MPVAPSEHRHRPRLSTIAAAGAINCMAVFGAATCPFSVYMLIVGATPWPWGVFVAGTSAAMAALFGYVGWRLCVRMFVVKRVRLLDSATLEIETWGGAILRACVPENVQRAVAVNDDLTVHLSIGSRRLIISSEEFTGNGALNRWLRSAITSK